MKSSVNGEKVTFLLLQERLLGLMNRRLNNGDFTERGLARFIGISQPQIHNVLKGKRRLQVALADRILQRFEIDLLNLLEDFELRGALVASAKEPNLPVGEQPIPRKGPARARLNQADENRTDEDRNVR